MQCNAMQCNNIIYIQKTKLQIQDVSRITITMLKNMLTSQL
jgi:hypothetical protein